jgi:hypothetical protein
MLAETPLSTDSGLLDWESHNHPGPSKNGAQAPDVFTFLTSSPIPALAWHQLCRVTDKQALSSYRIAIWSATSMCASAYLITLISRSSQQRSRTQFLDPHRYDCGIMGLRLPPAKLVALRL